MLHFNLNGIDGVGRNFYAFFNDTPGKPTGTGCVMHSSVKLYQPIQRQETVGDHIRGVFIDFDGFFGFALILGIIC